MEKRKRRFGDRKDGFRLRNEVPAMNRFMPYLLVRRSANEAVLKDTLDFENATAYLNAKNEKLPEGTYRYTIFHLIVAALYKTIYHRERLNRFIQGRRFYQRFDISFSFVIKKRFEDTSEEGLAIITFDEDGVAPIENVYQKVRKEVTETRVKNKTDSTTGVINKLVKLPRFLLRFVCSCLKMMDYFGTTPKSLMKDDPYYTSVFISNIGSIKMSADYHHLADYGTNSFFALVGEKKKRPVFSEDGTYKMKDTIDVAFTVDERIADGLYFAKSFKIFKKLIEFPELLDEPIETPIDVENACGKPQTFVIDDERETKEDI